MKKIPTYIAILLFATAIMCISSCDKKDPEPPEPPAPPMLTEATQTGKHSLSFMLNDEVWISRTGWGDLQSSISVSSKSLSIGSQGPTGYFSLGLTLNDWSPDIYIYIANMTRLEEDFSPMDQLPISALIFLKRVLWIPLML